MALMCGLLLYRGKVSLLHGPTTFHRASAVALTPGGCTLFSLDGECVFPFWYKNKLFYDCIKYGMRHKWCSLNKTFEGHWKYCSETDFAPCVFPFWYERLIYWECTDDGDDFGRKWCSLTKNYNKDQAWKYC
uniref:Binder of sperm protein homolog 1 n=2 Tax=Marmotini TaxID=337730 RepID=A0A8C9PW55_SPEDA